MVDYCFVDGAEHVTFFETFIWKMVPIIHNLSIHLSLEVGQKCAESKVNFISLPVNPTHIIYTVVDYSFLLIHEKEKFNFLVSYKKIAAVFHFFIC